MDYASGNVTDYMDVAFKNLTGVLFNETQESSIQNDTQEDYALTLEFFIELAREEQILIFYGVHFYTIFVVSLIVCILGYITNTLNVIVLCKTPMSNSMNLFLIVLSLSDIAQITTQFAHILHYWSGFKLFPYFDWVVFFIANTFIENVFTYVSNWLVTVIGIWRCIVITWPLLSRQLCSPYRAKIAIIAVFVLSFVLSTPILFLFSYQSVEDKDFGFIFYDKDIASFAKENDELILKAFFGLQQLKGIVPMLVMIGATVWMVVILYRIRRVRIKVLQKEMSSGINHRITAMLTILLVLYLLSNLPDSLMFLYQVVKQGESEANDEFDRNTDILRIFTLANSCASFFIYYGLGEDFRKRFNHIFCRCPGRTRKKSSLGEGLSESSTVRSKSFDVGSVRKTSGGPNALHLKELGQAVQAREVNGRTFDTNRTN